MGPIRRRRPPFHLLLPAAHLVTRAQSHFPGVTREKICFSFNAKTSQHVCHDVLVLTLGYNVIVPFRSIILAQKVIEKYPGPSAGPQMRPPPTLDPPCSAVAIRCGACRARWLQYCFPSLPQETRTDLTFARIRWKATLALRPGPGTATPADALPLGGTNTPGLRPALWARCS